MKPEKMTQLSSAPYTCSEYDKDKWDFENLGLSPLATTGGRSFNFTTIEPRWLRLAAKHYIRYSLAILQPGTALSRLTSLKSFARFLKQVHPALQPQNIDRSLVVEYLGHLRQRDLANSSRCVLISGLNSFLQLSTQNQWLPLSAAALIYRQDFPQQKKINPAFSLLKCLFNSSSTWEFCPCLTGA